MNESETRAKLIDPALKEAGWGVVEGSRVRREAITLGRLQGEGLLPALCIKVYPWGENDQPEPQGKVRVEQSTDGHGF